VNVEGKRQSDDKGWSGTTEISFDYNDSEQIDWEFNNTSHLQWDNESWSVLLINEINLDRAGGVNFENDGFQHFRLSKHINPRYTSETFVQNQFDPVRKIENRKLFGSGVRMKLSEKNFIGVSTFYELESLTNDVANKDIRLSTYLQLDFEISEKIQILSTTYLQPNIKQFLDFKLSTESQLNFEITKNLSFTNTIEAIYDTYPASGVKEYSYSLQNGIQYKF
jgi:hypothetical protein